MEKKSFPTGRIDPENANFDPIAEKLILVGILDVPDQGILLARYNYDLFELPGGAIKINFDLRKINSQPFREIGFIQKQTYEQTQIIISNNALLIANYHFPDRNRSFKAFLLEATNTPLPDPAWQKIPGFNTSFIKKEEITDLTLIKYPAKKILLDYIEREKEIKSTIKLHSPFASIITIAG